MGQNRLGVLRDRGVSGVTRALCLQAPKGSPGAASVPALSPRDSGAGGGGRARHHGPWLGYALERFGGVKWLITTLRWRRSPPGLEDVTSTERT